MNLYKIEQSQNRDYDTYDSAVVVAQTPDEAARIHPGQEQGFVPNWWVLDEDGWSSKLTTWAPPQDVKVTFLGVADGMLKPDSVVCASFNAG